jgi:1-acyl-sn-glycerol-3-phosphate acyltransferase
MLQRILERLSRFLVTIFFREIIIEGRENLPAKGPVLFTPNHPHALIDPLLLQLFSPQYRIRFVAKAPLFKIPVFGSILRSLGAIPVVRRIDVNQDVDYTAFFAACVDALAQNDSIAIFPEADRFRSLFLRHYGPAPHAYTSWLAKDKFR